MTPLPGPGLIVDALGFLTGIVLYVMLVVMVWRERVAERAPFLSRSGRLPLFTGLFGVVWNVVALFSFGTRVVGAGEPPVLIEAIAFGALACLPATVVHSLIEGREAAPGRAATRPLIGVAYALSATAAAMMIIAALRGAPVPSRPALWLLTGGFTALTIVLLVVTRRQPIGRRGIWVAALAIFAVSAWHFSSHVGNEPWWVELTGHHASLLLALAILHQDYRFALADLFLKNAIALILLMGVSLALFSGAVTPLLRWFDASGGTDPRAVALIVCVWMAAAISFPLLRRLAGVFVDRVVLRRPDYGATMAELAAAVEAAETEDAALDQIARAIGGALGVADCALATDPLPGDDERIVVVGPDARRSSDAATVALLRLRTVEAPHRALAIGSLAAGRRLLSDDVRLLESVSRLGARRLDAIRVAQERLERNLREQRIERLASEAELRALRAQLNPHFLFNALTTIGYLVTTSPERALDTLLRLTNVLRGVLRRTTTEFSTLGEEIDFIESYLEIEQARFEERLGVTIDVDPGVRHLILPTLLLQPLVENAVKHGLAPRHRGGRIAIRAAIEGDALAIRIEDTGVGFDAGAPGARTGVGLTSVAQRLQAHYAGDARLRITSAFGAGTVVDLSIPLRLAADTGVAVRRRSG